MKEIVFRALFWVLWPLIWVYAPLRARARVLVVCGNEFLAVKPYFGAGDWQLPGGGIKFGELASDAAVRELREEVSVSLKDLHSLIPAQTYSEKGLLLRYVLFYKKVATKPQTIKNHEIADTKWLPITELDGCASHVMSAVNAID